jgi:hypothetical protein
MPSATAQGSDDFILERMRFSGQLGYWMNEPLYRFTVGQALAEDYCFSDLKKAHRRIGELRGEAERATGLAIAFKAQADNAAGLLKGQGELLDKALARAEKERNRKVRWRRATMVGVFVGAAGGFYLAEGSR